MADPKTEAAEKHLYRIVTEDGEVCMDAEMILGRLEGQAAEILRRLEEPGVDLSADARSMLGLFVVMQRVRTPFGREWIKQVDENLAVARAKETLMHGERSEGSGGGHLSPDEREGLLEDLDSGAIWVESPPDRLTALMFLTWQEQAEILVNQCEWGIFRAPEGTEFVISDNPVAHYDPTLTRLGGGLGFLSSKYTTTNFPVDPSYAICIRPRGHPAWGDGVTDAATVQEINLMTYAWAEHAVYGRNQKVLTDLRRYAKRNPRRLAKYPRANPQLLFEGEAGGDLLALQGRVRLATLPRSMQPGWLYE